MSQKQITFIGLGVMGYHMAGHLAKNGHPITVYNRTHEKAIKWSNEFGGNVAKTLDEALAKAEIIFLCVGNDEDVKSVLLTSDGKLRKLRDGTTIVDHTTASAQLAREISQKTGERKMAYLDAPVSGGSVGAEKGTLTIMVGGNAPDYERILPLLKHYGANINLMGSAGSGQLTKMVNQICIAGALQGVAEAMNFGVNAKLDMEKVLTVISKGAAQSWQLENRGPWMLNKKYEMGGFTVDLMKKDLTLCIGEANLTKSSLPLTKLVSEQFQKLQSNGHGKWDFSSLFALLRNTK